MKIDMERSEWRKILDLLIVDSLNTDNLDEIKDGDEFTKRVNLIDSLVCKYVRGKIEDAEY